MSAFDDLNLLRAFVRIVEAGSISGGARLLNLPQPTLSRHLKTLEGHCGTALLRRDTHQMNLTEAGQRFLTDVRAVLAHADEAQQRLHEDRTMLSGHLRLFATIDCGQFMVTRLVSSFLQQNPKVTASLGISNRPLHMIQEGCDVGIQPGKITDDRVIARTAGMIRLSLAASPSLLARMPVPKKPDSLETWPWISLAGSHFWGPREIKLLGRGDSEHLLRISPVLTCEGVTSIREAARSGLGISLLPDWMIEKDLASGRLVRVLPTWRAKDLPIHVVYAGQRMLPARVSAFIDFAVAYLVNELEPPKRG